MLVKICGTTSAPDAQLAARAGADYLGVIVEHAPSPRSVSLPVAREIAAATELPTVAVTVNQSREFLLNLWREQAFAALQLHGDELPELVRELIEDGIVIWAACSTRERALEMQRAGASTILIDARSHENGEIIYGGTGARGDWSLTRELAQRGARVILAGGLDSENVAEAIDFAHPWMVDVVSGVEARKGAKDAVKVESFIRAAKSTSELRRTF